MPKVSPKKRGERQRWVAEQSIPLLHFPPTLRTQGRLIYLTYLNRMTAKIRGNIQIFGPWTVSEPVNTWGTSGYPCSRLNTLPDHLGTRWRSTIARCQLRGDWGGLKLQRRRGQLFSVGHHFRHGRG